LKFFFDRKKKTTVGKTLFETLDINSYTTFFNREKDIKKKEFMGIRIPTISIFLRIGNHALYQQFYMDIFDLFIYFALMHIVGSRENRCTF